MQNMKKSSFWGRIVYNVSRLLVFGILNNFLEIIIKKYRNHIILVVIYPWNVNRKFLYYIKIKMFHIFYFFNYILAFRFLSPLFPLKTRGKHKSSDRIHSNSITPNVFSLSSSRKFIILSLFLIFHKLRQEKCVEKPSKSIIYSSALVRASNAFPLFLLSFRLRFQLVLLLHLKMRAHCVVLPVGCECRVSVPTLCDTLREKIDNISLHKPTKPAIQVAFYFLSLIAWFLMRFVYVYLVVVDVKKQGRHFSQPMSTEVGACTECKLQQPK